MAIRSGVVEGDRVSARPPYREHVVIVGGGFGGLSCAESLRGADVRVTVVDRFNHHVFQPLLYQVATAGLSPAQIAAPIRQILSRQANASVLMAEVAGVDPDRRGLRLGDGQLDYDVLVLSAGAATSWFGHDAWAAAAPGLKTIDDALRIRERLMESFERAERASEPPRKYRAEQIGEAPGANELNGSR